MFLHVTDVRYLEEHKLELSFNNGAIMEVDLKNELYGEVFEPLQEVEYFKQAVVNEETNAMSLGPIGGAKRR